MLDIEKERKKVVNNMDFEGLPEPSKMLLEEVLKVLYLNNIAPHKVHVICNSSIL